MKAFAAYSSTAPGSVDSGLARGRGRLVKANRFGHTVWKRGTTRAGGVSRVLCGGVDGGKEWGGRSEEWCHVQSSDGERDQRVELGTAEANLDVVVVR